MSASDTDTEAAHTTELVASSAPVLACAVDVVVGVEDAAVAPGESGQSVAAKLAGLLATASLSVMFPQIP